MFADRVRDTSISVGTGNFVLSGVPPVGFQSFGSAFQPGTVTTYTIVDTDNGDWEVGLGTYTAPGGTPTLTRDIVYSNSLGTTALINFGGFTKQVFVSYVAEDAATLGLQCAMQAGLFLT